MTGLAVDVRDQGLLAWDTDIDYLQHAITHVDGVMYRATRGNRPSHQQRREPGHCRADGMGHHRGHRYSLPEAPRAPTAVTPESGELDWFWNCPEDGGNEVTEFDFQWRVAGTIVWSASVVVAYARTGLTGLANGTAIQARVLARTAFGEGPWSPTGSATPQGRVPDGGSTLALRTDAGDTEAVLDWLEPDDGGVAITSYTVQWRDSGQAFSTGQEDVGNGDGAHCYRTRERHGVFFPGAGRERPGPERMVERGVRDTGRGDPRRGDPRPGRRA